MYDLDWLLARTARKQKTKYLYFWGHQLRSESVV